MDLRVFLDIVDISELRAGVIFLTEKPMSLITSKPRRGY